MAEAGPPPSGNWWDDLQSSVTSFKLPDLPDIEMPNLTPPGTGNPFALWGNDAAVPAADGQEAAPTVLPTAPVQDPVAPVQVSRDVNVDLGAVGSRDVAFDLGGDRYVTHGRVKDVGGERVLNKSAFGFTWLEL